MKIFLYLYKKAKYYIKMNLTEQHIITKQNKQWKIIDNLCFLSKNLYNQALYEIKQNYMNTGKFLRYKEIEKLLKNKEEEFNDYYKLPPATSQNILMLLDKNLKSYFALLKKWKKDKTSLSGCPKIPKYKHKIKGRNIIIIRGDLLRLKKSYIIFPKKFNLSPLKTNIEDISLVKQCRIIPSSGCYNIEIVYEVKEKEYKKNNNKCAIDLGVSNLASLTTNLDLTPLIINGRPLKSINQFYNKKKGKMQSWLKICHGKRTSNRLTNLIFKRNNKIKDYLHKSSRIIVNYLVENDISNLAIGYNKNWKQKVNMNKTNNQNFVSIPYETFINMIIYKCELEGIKVTLTRESHTSKCSALDLEFIEHHDNYIGRRIKRGLFKSKNKILLNADVNGSLNIGRKVFGDGFIPANRGLVFNPIKINIF